MVSFFVSPSLSTILKLRNVWNSENTITNTSSSAAVGFNGKSSLSFVSSNVSYKVTLSKWLSPLSGSSASFITAVSKKESSLKPFFYNVALTSFSRCNVT